METTTCTTRDDGMVVCVDSEGVIIAEDDPRWDCQTMGNLLCGPTVEIGTAVVIERPTELATTGGAEVIGALIGLGLIVAGWIALKVGGALALRSARRRSEAARKSLYDALDDFAGLK